LHNPRFAVLRKTRSSSAQCSRNVPKLASTPRAKKAESAAGHPRLKPQQRQEIVKLVKRGKKTAADAARLFGVHPATVSRLLQRT
jgi:transcriptional regulator with GAF, ATPase, and Fis domain